MSSQLTFHTVQGIDPMRLLLADQQAMNFRNYLLGLPYQNVWGSLEEDSDDDSDYVTSDDDSDSDSDDDSDSDSDDDSDSDSDEESDSDSEDDSDSDSDDEDQTKYLLQEQKLTIISRKRKRETTYWK